MQSTKINTSWGPSRVGSLTLLHAAAKCRLLHRHHKEVDAAMTCVKLSLSEWYQGDNDRHHSVDLVDARQPTGARVMACLRLWHALEPEEGETIEWGSSAGVRRHIYDLCGIPKWISLADYRKTTPLVVFDHLTSHVDIDSTCSTPWKSAKYTRHLYQIVPVSFSTITLNFFEHLECFSVSNHR